jgi:hypothetical protein
MKINKLDRFETKTTLEPSPEQIQQAKQTFVNLLTPIVEKMLKSPGDIKPVAESFEELARQAKSGVKRSAELTKIISGGAEKKGSEIVTLHNSGDSEKKGSEIVTKFDLSELEILRKIENGEY